MTFVDPCNGVHIGVRVTTPKAWPPTLGAVLTGRCSTCELDLIATWTTAGWTPWGRYIIQEEP